MGKSPGAKRFWRLCGPMLLYWLIDFLVKMLVEAVLIIPHISEIIKNIKNAVSAGVSTQEQIAEAAMAYVKDIFDLIMKYQVHILTAGAVCTIPLTAYLFFKDRGRERQFNIPVNKKAEPLKYLRIVGFGFAACIGFNCLSFMTNLALMSEQYQQASKAMYSVSFPMQLVCLGVIVPFAEELMFRGILFKRFREIAGFTRSALFSAMLFSFVHGNIVQMIYTFILAIFLAYVYEKFGSLKAPVLLHIIMNVTSLIVTQTGGFDWLVSDAARMSIVTVMCAFVGSIIFVSIQRINEKPDLPKPPQDHMTSDMFR